MPRKSTLYPGSALVGRICELGQVVGADRDALHYDVHACGSCQVGENPVDVIRVDEAVSYEQNPLDFPHLCIPSFLMPEISSGDRLSGGVTVDSS